MGSKVNAAQIGCAVVCWQRWQNYLSRYLHLSPRHEACTQRLHKCTTCRRQRCDCYTPFIAASYRLDNRNTINLCGNVCKSKEQQRVYLPHIRVTQLQEPERQLCGNYNNAAGVHTCKWQSLLDSSSNTSWSLLAVFRLSPLPTTKRQA